MTTQPTKQNISDFYFVTELPTTELLMKIKSAYLQGIPMDRELYITPPKEKKNKNVVAIE